MSNAFKEHLNMAYSNKWRELKPELRMGVAILDITTALEEYAAAYRQRYESPISDDGVLGKNWVEILQNTRGLLNGELGPYDGGTLDGELCKIGRQAGFTDSEL